MLRRFSALLVALALVGCGRSEKVEDSRVIGDALTVYSSLPQTGPLAPISRDLVRAEKLALEEAGGQAGGYRVSYVSLDSADPKTGRWTPAVVADNARTAVEDLQTIAYLGELESGASAISVPILNEGGMLQVSPGDTFAGLTAPVAPGEPEKYYPSGRHTFARTVAPDTDQAQALASLMKTRGVKRVWIAHDRQVAGVSLANLLTRRLRSARIEVVHREGLDAGGDVPDDIAEKVHDERADAFVYAGAYRPFATELLRAVHAGAPRVQLFGPDSFAIAPEMPVRVGAAAERLTVTAVDYERSRETRVFERRFEQRYGSEPHARAILAYDAMQLVLQAIDAAGADAGSRPAVIREALRAADPPRGGFAAFRVTDQGLLRVAPDL
jgi:branched-chain amino acid transport system substrate-binding protein